MESIYQIRNHETGTVIEETATLEEAVSIMNQFVEEDESNNVYVPHFYEVYNPNTFEVVEVSE